MSGRPERSEARKKSLYVFGESGGIRTELCPNPSSGGIGVDFPLVETGFKSSFCADVINHNDLSSGYELPSLSC